MLKFKLKVLGTGLEFRHQQAMIIALEKTTEAVAHVLTDLKRR